jgi:hypothetical protein
MGETYTVHRFTIKREFRLQSLFKHALIDCVVGTDPWRVAAPKSQNKSDGTFHITFQVAIPVIVPTYEYYPSIACWNDRPNNGPFVKRHIAVMKILMAHGMSVSVRKHQGSEMCRSVFVGWYVDMYRAWI